MLEYRRLLRLLRVAWRGQTYRNIAFLLLTGAMGTLHFIMLCIGVSLGVGLAVLGVGVVILWATMGYAWGMAYLERYLAATLLRVEIGPLAAAPGFTYPWKPREIWRHVTRLITWKSLLYLGAEFPLGIVSFVVAVTLLSISLCLLLFPVGGVVQFAVASSGHADGASPYAIVTWVWRSVPQPLAFLLDGALLVLVPLLGAYVTAGSMYLLNGAAFAWGHFARLLLGTSYTEQQLAEARTRARREEERAEQSDRRRRELIVNVSHELRTPIATIRGHVESLRPPLSERLDEPEKQRYLAIIAREADRLSALVDDLLSLARADTDELHLEVQPVDAGAVVEDVYQALAPLALRERQVTLVRNVANGLPCVLADCDRLAQVLLNLARNAITATPAGGLVFVDLEQAGDDHIALSVSDTGHGMPAEDLERVFERFYRTDAARQRSTGGFGLGLSIVRDLVQAMGGTVSVTSTINAGSTFRVLLRAAGEPRQQPM